MDWPQIRTDLTAVSLKSGESLIAVICRNKGDIFPWCAHASPEVNSMKLDDYSEDPEIHSLLQQKGGVWAGVQICVATITGGQHIGRRAVGAGTSVQKRKKATRLAIEVTVRVFNGPCLTTKLEPILIKAQNVLAFACHEPPAVDKHDKEPSQNREVAPPMDTEVIVQWAPPSAWMWHAWLPPKTQAQVHEGYPWSPHAVFPSPAIDSVPQQGGTVNSSGTGASSSIKKEQEGMMEPKKILEEEVVSLPQCRWTASAENLRLLKKVQEIDFSFTARRASCHDGIWCK